jgi:hypothetical protein
VHGTNARNLSLQLSLSQTSKNAMSFLLSATFSLQQNQGRSGQWGQEEVTQTLYTQVSKCKNDKEKKDVSTD